MRKLKVIVKSVIMAMCLFIGIIFYGCDGHSQAKQRKCTLIVKNGEGFESGSSTINCDSFQMQGTRKAVIWVDGYKMNIEANNVIYPIVK